MSIYIYQLVWSFLTVKNIIFWWHWQINFSKFNYSHLVVANDLFDYLPALMIVVGFYCWIFIMAQSWFLVFWQLNLISILLFIDVNLTFMLGIYMYNYVCTFLDVHQSRSSMYASCFVGCWVIHQTRRFPPSVSLIISHCYC